MIKISGHHKVLSEAVKTGVLKRGQNAEVTVTHRHGCRAHWHPSCDCRPRVNIKTSDTGKDEATVVRVVHHLTDGRVITSKDGVRSVTGYKDDGSGSIIY
jgi:hypothetical protein